MHRYYLINRPPSIGTHPPGEVARETWVPRQTIPGTERDCYGWVEWSEPLPFEQVWRYEMLPADDGELMGYYDWRELMGK